MMDPMVKMISEYFIKVMANQSLIMLGLSTIVDNEKASQLLHDQAMKIVKENDEAIEYLRIKDKSQ